MNFFRFLRSKSLALCAALLCACIWATIAYIVGVNAVFVVLSLCALALAIVLWLGAEYALSNHRIERVKRLFKEVEEPHLVSELLPRPLNAAEEEYFAVMKNVSRSAIGAVETERSLRREYCEYVESWIHEIKTPLTACSLILSNGGDPKKLRAELKRAENLTENILYLARLRTIETDTQISAVSVRAVADGAVKSQMELLLAAGVSVEVEGDFTAYTDAKAVEFVLKQLLSNAAKYCPRGHVSIAAQGNELCVQDDGCGISPHELPRVFARGFVGSAGRRSGGGTGMGLYIAHELCSSLGVGLGVQSKEGEYTRFTLLFPQAQSARAEGNLTKM